MLTNFCRLDEKSSELLELFSSESYYEILPVRSLSSFGDIYFPVADTPLFPIRRVTEILPVRCDPDFPPSPTDMPPSFSLTHFTRAPVLRIRIFAG